MPAPATLWSRGAALDAAMLEYTAGDDRHWDARLLQWDIVGSLGHVAGLRASGLLSEGEHRRLRAGLRAALRAADAGELRLTRADEDVHTAVERWLTRRLGPVGERLHTGRSRNDQVACDLRLYAKHRLIATRTSAAALADALLGFAARYRRALWPGYTHQRRAMPSSAGLWAAGYAEGLIDTLESLSAVWRLVDRSPLGSGAGYGVPLPLRREVAARALGFAGLDHHVTTVQNARGKTEAAILFWCSQLAHDAGKLAHDVILFSAEEFGFLIIPPGLATGSSIMPHKRNPDLFELTRGRAAAVDADLTAVLQLKGKLPGGYHRDFQLLKEPFMRGLDRIEQMLAMLAVAVPKLVVNQERAWAAIDRGALSTDEVMRRVEDGTPFRRAYRAVSAELRSGAALPPISAGEGAAHRRSTGGMGNLGLAELRRRLAANRRWADGEGARFQRAVARLARGGR